MLNVGVFAYLDVHLLPLFFLDKTPRYTRKFNIGPKNLPMGGAMNIQTMTSFFMWCTIINGALLILWTVLFLLAPNFIYRIQHRWFPIPRETFDVVIYSFLGCFKIVFIIFNLVPWISLLIIG
jgi:hypothetical protein